ncbi:MAG: type II secretion system protein [Calditrichaeota bacterium]|nr:type II secretion system protein [Calditrichota bacterium]
MQFFSKKKTPGEKGFTMIELIVVIVMTSIIAGVVARFLVFGVDAYHFVDERKRALHEARLALHLMNSEFRQVRDPSGLYIAQDDKLQFVNYSNQVNTYLYSNNRLFKNGFTIAENVTSFHFYYLKADGTYLQTPVSADSLTYVWNIEASYTIQMGAQSVPFHLLVHPRNY